MQNAIDAMGEVRTESRQLRLATKRSGEKIALEMEDTGPGIDESKSKQIFDAFVTTTHTEMRLGLAIFWMIIDRRSGMLSVTNAPQLHISNCAAGECE